MLYDIVSQAWNQAQDFSEGAIGKEVWDAIRLHITPQSKTLEFGCGMSTLLFDCSFCRHTAIDNNRKWIDLVNARNLSSGTTLIHSDLNPAGFYESVPEEQFDLILIDGPAGEGSRVGVLYVIEKLVKKGTAIIVDDTNREKDKQLSLAIQKLLCASHVVEGDTSYNRKFDMIIV